MEKCQDTHNFYKTLITFPEELYVEIPYKIATPHSNPFACQLAHYHRRGSVHPLLWLHHVCDLKQQIALIITMCEDNTHQTNNNIQRTKLNIFLSCMVPYVLDMGCQPKNKLIGTVNTKHIVKLAQGNYYYSK